MGEGITKLFWHVKTEDVTVFQFFKLLLLATPQHYSKAFLTTLVYLFRHKTPHQILLQS